MYQVIFYFTVIENHPTWTKTCDKCAEYRQNLEILSGRKKIKYSARMTAFLWLLALMSV